jgi:hypothetical protein
MERQLVLREVVNKKPLEFKDEINEIILSLNLPKYSNKTGNKQFTENQKLTCVILYFRSKLSLREFCDYFNQETMWPRWLQLRYKITKSTLNRWIQGFSMDFIKQILQETIKYDSPEILGIDGTGLSSKYKSSYYQKRLMDYGLNPKSPYHKLDIICDLKGKKKIYDFTFTMKQYNDKKQAKRLFNRFKLRNITIIGDKGYYYFYLFSKMKSMNNIFIVPPLNKGGREIHNNIVRKQFQQTFKDYQDLYPLRNNVEGVFSALKRTILTKIVSKKATSKRREVSFKIIIYNMKKNIFMQFLFFKYCMFFNQNYLIRNGKLINLFKD